MPMSRNEHGISNVAIISIVLIVLAGFAITLLVERHSSPQFPAATTESRPPLGPEQKAYLPLLVFGEFHMSAAENFLGNTVIYLDGKVTNRGDKPVRSLDVELNFVDTLNQVVLRETAHPLTRRAGPLAPGETRPFRVTFEHMPADWNQTPPTAKAVYVQF